MFITNLWYIKCYDFLRFETLKCPEIYEKLCPEIPLLFAGIPGTVVHVAMSLYFASFSSLATCSRLHAFQSCIKLSAYSAKPTNTTSVDSQAGLNRYGVAALIVEAVRSTVLVLTMVVHCAACPIGLSGGTNIGDLERP